MSKRRYPFKKYPAGFSLVEMLIATGIMAIGLVMVATIFPVGMKLTGMSAERSVAAVTADEAFAKIQLYGLRDFANWPVTDPNVECSDYSYVTSYAGPDNVWNSGDESALEKEFLYPSAELSLPETHKFHWSALCRRTGENDVQVTVFVTRKSFSGLSYYGYDPAGPAVSNLSWPLPVPLNIQYDGISATELIVDASDPINAQWDTDLSQTNTVYSFVDEGYRIVNDRDGRIYRILEMKDELPSGSIDGIPETLVLFDNWQPDPAVTTFPYTETIWVVPPGVGSSRYPCVGVFQKVIRFDEIE